MPDKPKASTKTTEPEAEPDRKPAEKPESAPASEDKEKKEKPSSDAQDEARAQTSLRLGQALERSGKLSGAIDYYRRVVKEYPDTKAATAAKERLKALGGE